MAKTLRELMMADARQWLSYPPVQEQIRKWGTKDTAETIIHKMEIGNDDTFYFIYALVRGALGAVQGG